MQLVSTRNTNQSITFEEALFKGLPDDNGLFVPREIQPLPDSFFDRLPQLTFNQIAFEVSKHLLEGEVSDSKLEDIVTDAFNFPVPVSRLDAQTAVIELYHGPSLAFKDFGARYMSRLMAHFLKDHDEEITVLVATSGDTGGAVGNGFTGVDGTNVIILYPSGKVSKDQERQLTTLGENVQALKVHGTFDDCQALVKQAFLDKEIAKHRRLSSANSINISRLIPQSFYYFWAAAQMDAPPVFSVPSGNLGNLCGGLMASQLGLPVQYFIAATNINRTFPDYLSTGKYHPRPSVETVSNAMDVGAPSNYARITHWYDDMSFIKGTWFDDEQTEKAIQDVYHTYKCIMCPHTAVGYLGLKQFGGQPGVILSTAHPAKFQRVGQLLDQSVDHPTLQALRGKEMQFTRMENDFIAFKEFLMR